ncbi:uncharacterized protein LOC126833751 [Adelges cooleyi]|uniref:uncharacterized protein LOC126833751 n=1 Tax=Adelges cooleyi TaxID=133065 RepID=UPI00217F4C94|nr:uncharacterized protein LOC126833751 [Adelges cooleyi]
MATIRSFFMVLSVCVVCLFADDRFKKHDLLLLNASNELGVMRFVLEDGVCPVRQDRLDSMFIIKANHPHRPAYKDAMKKINGSMLPGYDKYKLRYLFNMEDVRFGTINVEDI